MLRLHGSYQLDQLSNREVCQKFSVAHLILSVNMHYLIYELLLHLHMYFCTITCTYYMIFLKIEFGHNSVGK